MATICKLLRRTNFQSCNMLWHSSKITSLKAATAIIRPNMTAQPLIQLAPKHWTSHLNAKPWVETNILTPTMVPPSNPLLHSAPNVPSDYEHFSFPNAQKPYLEFPILESGAFTDDESPGADRVVIGSISSDYSSAVFCAVITHDGSRKNGFTECKDDTVNTDGCVLFLY